MFPVMVPGKTQFMLRPSDKQTDRLTFKQTDHYNFVHCNEFFLAQKTLILNLSKLFQKTGSKKKSAHFLRNQNKILNQKIQIILKSEQ